MPQPRRRRPPVRTQPGYYLIDPSQTDACGTHAGAFATPAANRAPSLGGDPSPSGGSTPSPIAPAYLDLKRPTPAATSAMSPVPPREGDPGAIPHLGLAEMASPPTTTVTSSALRPRRHLCCGQRRGVRKRKIAEAFPAWRVWCRVTWERRGAGAWSGRVLELPAACLLSGNLKRYS